ncbi:MAG TPA: carboxypeptidase-like regulatory domain-containing protein [Bryobacteraceae bacterium]|nr:carboxypeptidase-like regulatory domain-containing protein [Bryobacteraceae bacterium]
MVRSFAFLLAALPLLAAQDTAKEAGSIRGTIKEMPGGTPAPEVSVRLHGRPTSKTAITDSAGRYEFRDLQPGEYFLSTHGDRYGKTSSGILAPPRRVRLLPGQNLVADFEVKTEAGISGRVLDRDRNPVPNARIQVWARVFVDGSPSFGLCRSAVTNDLGEFRVSGLADGRYYLSAGTKLLQFRKRPAGAKPDAKPKLADVGVFYPSEPSVVSAAPIYLGAGEQREGIDLVLPRVETYCAAGSVAAGAAGSGSLGLIASHGGWRSYVAHGTFLGNDEFEVCGIPPGSYRLEASTNKDGGYLSFGNTEFAIGERHVSLDPVHLASGVKVSGKAIVAGADPRDPFPSGIRVSLTPKDGFGIRKGEEISAVIGASGDLTIPNVFPDERWFRFNRMPSGYYVKEARMGAQDARRELVRPGSGELTIVLASDGASVSGSVADQDRPLPSEVIVVLAPASLPQTGVPGLVQTWWVDQTGGFEFDRVAPGKYLLLAFTGLAPGEGENPDFLRGHMSKAEELTVGPRDKKSVNLKVLNAH